MKKKLIIFFIVFFSFNLLANIEIKLYTNKDIVSTNETFKLTIEVIGTQSFQFVEQPKFEDNVYYIRNEESMNMSIINGNISSSKILSMYLKISKEGKYKFGPYKLKVNKNIYETPIVEVNCSNSNAQNSSSSRLNNSFYENFFEDFSEFKTNQNTNLNYLLKVNTNKSEVFVNEFLDISVNIYIRADIKPISYERLNFPKEAEWIIDLTSKDNQYKGVVKIKNLDYYCYEIEKKRVFFSKAGIYNIPPVIYNFYDMSARGWFFSPEPSTLRSDPINIKVNNLVELPESNGVGIFKINSNLKPDTLKENEITTLTIILEGEGNFHNLKDIDFDISDKENIEIYSSKSNIKDINQNIKQKIREVLLIPKKEGNYNITINDFEYFDINEKKNKIIKGDTFNLTVLKSEKQTNESIIVYNNNTKTNLNITNISYLQTNIGKKNKIFNYKKSFKIIISLYLFSILFIFIFIIIKFIIFKNSLKTTEYIKKNAYNNFLKSVNRISKNINKTNINKAIDEIYKSVELFFISKFQLNSIDLKLSYQNNPLKDFIPEDKLLKLRDINSSFDMIRFGGMDVDISEINKLIEQLKLLLRDIN